MTPEETQQLKDHVNAIAQLLHTDAQTQGMKMSTLGEIEQTVRTQLQDHVSPRLGIFLSTKIAHQTQAQPEN